jgi:hypothetical protein
MAADFEQRTHEEAERYRPRTDYAGLGAGGGAFMRIVLLLLATLVWTACAEDVRLRPAMQGGLGPTYTPGGGQVSGASHLPELPRAVPDTTWPTISRTRAAHSVADLTSALATALDGDEIVLDVGTNYGCITLPARTSGGGWVVIRSASGYPAQGTRIGPSATLAQFHCTTGGGPVITASGTGVVGYRLVGIEVWSDDFTYNMIDCEQCSRMTLDRVVVHTNANATCQSGQGAPCGTARRGLTMNGATLATVESYFYGIREWQGADASAIGGWDGDGPFLIRNNYLEASSENVIFGGENVSAQNRTPSDLTFTNNYLFKPLSWKTQTGYNVKNLFELKHMRRALVDSNTMENNWGDAQNGMSVLFTVRNQGGATGAGSYPWATIQDVMFSNNIIKNGVGGVNILTADDGFGGGPQSVPMARVTIDSNTWQNMGNGNGSGDARWFQIATGLGTTGTCPPCGPATNLVITNNTVTVGVCNQMTTAITVTGYTFADVQPGLTFSGNVGCYGDYGVIGDSTTSGNSTINHWLPNLTCANNVLHDTQGQLGRAPYPACFSFPGGAWP